MEKILDRFLRYIAIDTQADPNSESQPSAAKELNLSRLLCDELTAMGVQAELDEYGYVMATIPSNCDKDVPAIGFIAHVDTAPDAAGACTNPQIIENTRVRPSSLLMEQPSLVQTTRPELQKSWMQFSTL